MDLLLTVLSRRGDQVDVVTFHEGAEKTYPGITLHRIPRLPGVHNIRPGFSFKKLVCDVFVLAKALRVALPALDKQFPGFAGPDGLVAAPESRASSPVRIARDPDTRQAIGLGNLYPVGEGAGYAGGIVSAAIDGLRSAEAVVRRFARP